MKNILIVTISSVLLTACAKPMSELDEFIQRETQKPPPAIEPLPPVRVFPPKVYLASDRDPFVLGRIEEDEVASESLEDDPNKPDFDRSKELLEAYPLDALDMVGTLGANATMEALLKDPEGVVHRIRAGNYAGQNHGLITLIDEASVTVEERVQGTNGKWERREVSIALEDNTK